MNKDVIDSSIKQLEWLKFMITGNEPTKPNTFENAAKIYLDNAINILKEVIEK